MGKTAHWKPSQAGLLISTTVVLCLSDELLKKRGYRYLLTGRLIQDCLENIFSVVRLRKPIPSAYDVKCALKMICVSRYLHTPTSSNYNEDDSLHLRRHCERATEQDVWRIGSVDFRLEPRLNHLHSAKPDVHRRSKSSGPR